MTCVWAPRDKSVNLNRLVGTMPWRGDVFPPNRCNICICTSILVLIVVVFIVSLAWMNYTYKRVHFELHTACLVGITRGRLATHQRGARDFFSSSLLLRPRRPRALAPTARPVTGARSLRNGRQREAHHGDGGH